MMLTLLGIAWGVAVTLVFVEAARVLFVRFGGLRLTNWFGYLLTVVFLLAVPALQYYLARWLPLVSVLALVWATLEARATLRGWRSGERVRHAPLLGVPAAEVAPKIKPRRAA